MRVGVGFSDNPDSFAAGQEAALEALSGGLGAGPCDLLLMFMTARHDHKALRQAVSSVFGPGTPIYGGGAAGAITNERFGYAGDQMALAAIWLGGATVDIAAEGDLLQGSECEVGLKLGRKLAERGVKPESPLLLLYDAVDLTRGDMRLVMATRLLEGLEQGLGFLPDLFGAGLQGDHQCTPTPQWTGHEAVEHHALALGFGGQVRVDNVIMHGCRPITGYYTVTKAEEQVILEINGEPALAFLDRILGAGLRPEEYPFFLILGVNKGDKWGEFDENNYASRLCLGIDRARGGIVMFEPDMVAGTEFQIMYRSLDLGYMAPRIENLFAQAEKDGRGPVFALYIDCAGRAAGHGGLDLEDAVVVQKTVGGRVPLLGLYTGVEIASVRGRPRGLDWTGVFSLFSVPK